jgi:hypothetical protein
MPPVGRTAAGLLALGLAACAAPGAGAPGFRSGAASQAPRSATLGDAGATAPGRSFAGRANGGANTASAYAPPGLFNQTPAERATPVRPATPLPRERR